MSHVTLLLYTTRTGPFIFVYVSTSCDTITFCNIFTPIVPLYVEYLPDETANTYTTGPSPTFHQRLEEAEKWKAIENHFFNYFANFTV